MADDKFDDTDVQIAALEAEVKHHDKQISRLEDDVRGLHSVSENHKLILARLDGISDNVQQLAEDLAHSVQASNDQHKEMAEKVDKLRTEDLPQLKVEIAQLKVKSGVWGAIGGLVALATAILFSFFKHLN
jgi:chaperonin cofactor prefoldin